jgi:hypothetical protein
MEDRPDGVRSCEWVEAVFRRRGAKLTSKPLGRPVCRRPNFAPAKPAAWFAHTHQAIRNAFAVSDAEVRLRATAVGLNAHASVAFYHAGVDPGRRYTCSVEVDVTRRPSEGQAIWFVWVGGETGIEEWMGGQAMSTGRRTLTVTDVAPPGADRMLCAVGNGGPSRDGRDNAMQITDVSEFAVDPRTASLIDWGTAPG